MTKEEKCRDENLALGVSKFMGNIGFTREKLMCKLYSNYVRNGQEFKQRGFVLQAFHGSLSRLHNEGKGKRESKRGLEGKGGARAMCVGYTTSMREAKTCKRVEREKNAHFFGERERERVLAHYVAWQEVEKASKA